MRPSGMALVEALVAASLLALGLLGASRLTVRALDAALQTRQQEQALALAQDALDCALTRSPLCPASTLVTRQGTVYSVQMQQTPLAAQLNDISVRVQWQGSLGTQKLEWHTRQSGLPDWLGVSSP